MPTTRYGTAVLTTKLEAQAGDPIAFYVAIVNQSMDNLIVRFPTSKQFDFALLDAAGQEYWRWSTGKQFTQNETAIIVTGGTGGGFHVDGDELAALPAPPGNNGHVTLVGELPSSNAPFRGMLRIALGGDRPS